ncbi:MAG: helix-turn-helix domain-containing protein, partial [Bacteroidia bacterium]
RVQTDASTSAIPIIISTADPLLDEKLLGLKSGAVDYVFNPFLIEELVMKVRNQLRVSVSNSQNVPTMFSRIGPKANFLRALNTYLDQNFDNFQGIEEIAAGLHMSRSTFDKKVKQYSGLSSAHYLLNYKLGRAHQMLEEADLNISQIARLSGFASAAYFSTCFKNKYGVSPKKFVSTRLKILKSAHPQDCKLELESAIASLWKRFSPK